MKTVGKQLQDARLAKGWSPELAARETKIRVDRLHDLESDDYSNFSSPTYARGFVRTYARSLGIDEYKILRQLDNKLPEDDNASFANDTGVPYMPEASKVSKPFEVGKGVYVAGAVGVAMLLLIGFILLQVYRAGYFAQAIPATMPSAGSTVAPAVPDTETAARALPADSNAPPVALPVDANALAAAPAAAATTPAAAPALAASDTNAAPRALPVDPAALTATAAPTVATTSPSPAVVTLPPTSAPDAAAASPAATAGTTPTDTPTPPRAQPVDLSTLGSAPADATAAPAVTPAPTTVPETTAAPSISARQSNQQNAISVTPPQSTDSIHATQTSAAAGPTGPEVAANASPASIPAAQPSTSQGPAEAPPTDSAPNPSTPVEATSAMPVAQAVNSPDAAGNSTAAGASSAPAAPSTDVYHGSRLILTASQDSFIRVVALDGPEAGQVRYDSILHGGQSIAFNGRRYSIKVANPAAVDIALDGVNYGPHSDRPGPDTFTVESHLP